MEAHKSAESRRFRIEKLEERIAPSITFSCVKQPGPTDTRLATNPAGNEAVGQTTIVKNNRCR